MSARDHTKLGVSDRAAAVDIALSYLTALGGHDPAAVTALVSEGFKNQHHAELGGGCDGRDEYANRLPGFFGTFANREYRVVEVTAGPALATADSADGTGRIEVVVNYRFGADVEGTRIDIPGVMWISVEDGLVQRRLDCWDSLTFHRQTGLPVEPPGDG